MSSAKTRATLRLVVVWLWLVFTVTFAIWWFTFSLEHISTLADLQPDRLEHWHRQKRMVIWEASTWLVLLIGGGAALIVLAQREKLRARRIREFFASFSHDVKTSLASLRIQAESLADETPASPILERLVGDTVRLQLQLENSLFLASQDELKLIPERLRLAELVERLREQWPMLQITSERDALILGDERALRTVFSNLAKNALVHGQASEIRIQLEVGPRGSVRLIFADNGQGFSGSHQDLGRLFHRPQSSSGSGLGLYISRLLLEKMGGRLHFHAGHQGFRVELVVRGELK